MYAAIPKIMNPLDFAIDVYNYKMLPNFAVGLVAAALPWLEIVIGIFLLLGIRIRAASLAFTGMLTVFTLAIFINTLRGIDVDCGCFVSDRSIGWKSVAEDTLLTLLGVWCFLFANNFFDVENLVKKRIYKC